ncbi:uncharacterized protein LOC135463069 [Liolophura sinensis]|uniref:uncharacterized protein LOC135463069 n=1 Tax=Liolophura sinensis TaxID=3198878 RepID=UPI003158BDB3
MGINSRPRGIFNEMAVELSRNTVAKLRTLRSCAVVWLICSTTFSVTAQTGDPQFDPNALDEGTLEPYSQTTSHQDSTTFHSSAPPSSSSSSVENHINGSSASSEVSYDYVLAAIHISSVPWSPQLAMYESQEFRELATNVTDEVECVFRKSAINDSVVNVMINGFRYTSYYSCNIPTSAAQENTTVTESATTRMTQVTSRTTAMPVTSTDPLEPLTSATTTLQAGTPMTDTTVSQATPEALLFNYVVAS